MSQQHLMNYQLYKTANTTNNNNNSNSSNYQPLPYNYPIETPIPDLSKTSTPNYPTQIYQRDPSYDYNQPYCLPPRTLSNNNNEKYAYNPMMPPTEQWNEKSMLINNKIKEEILSSPADDTLTHLVSPEAIREAQKEEKEEAMGNSQRRPFSGYTSFLSLKQHTPEQPKMLDLYPEEVNYTEEEYQPAEETQKISFMSQQEKLKRPPNAYLLFNRDMRRKLLKATPKMTVGEISKEIGDWWKILPAEKKEYYVKEASLLKEEHLKKYPDFIYTRRSKAELAEAKRSSKLGRKLKSEQPDEDDTKKRTKKTGERDPRGRKKKRHKHPFAPKHPMSAYLYYLASVYPKVSQHFPGSTVGPISKSISKTWHAMTVEDRQPWTQKAELDKARYAREMKVYMDNNTMINTVTNTVFYDNPPVISDEDNSSKYDEYEDDVDLHTLEAVVSMVNKEDLYPQQTNWS